MPSNTGLYNDSDDDSLSNELGPSDGYFNQRAPHPQQVLVPDPSLEAEGDKAREAQQEEEAQRQSEASPPRRRDSQYVQSPPPRRTFNSAYEGDQTSEQTPLLPTAPPAYSDATAGTSYRPPASSNPVESGNRRPSGGYDTIRPSEAFPHHSEPQHLRDSQAQSQDSPNKHERMQRSRRYVRRCCGATAKFVLVAVAIAIGVGFIVNAITSIHGVTRQPIENKPTGDDRNKVMPPINGQKCAPGNYKRSLVWEFDISDQFEFIQMVQDRGDYYQAGAPDEVQTAGEIHVKSNSDRYNSKIRVIVGFQYSDPGLASYYSVQLDHSFLHISTPGHFSSNRAAIPSNSRPCIYMLVDIWIPQGATLEQLAIHAQSLSIIFHPGLSYTVTNVTEMTATVGSITMPPYDSSSTSIVSRETVIHLLSGSITGSYPLYDRLAITTHSGSINIDIVPKEASSFDPAPAVLELSSNSGHITARTTILSSVNPISKHIPNRDYRTYITTDSASIDATFFHGTETTIRTITGHLQANLVPYGHPSSPSSIETYSASGSQDITVHSSLSHPETPLRHLWGKYTVSTGSLRIKYPFEWEGSVTGKTMSGNINLAWDGLIVSKDGREGYVWRVLKAVKGDGDGKLEFSSLSGSISLRGEDSGWLDGDGDEMEGSPPGEGSGAPPVRWPGYDDEWGMEKAV